MNTAPQRPTRAVSSIRNYSASFAGELDDSESIVGNPIIEEQVTNDLLISNIAITQAETIINKKKVATGKAVLFTTTGGVVINSPYTMKITISTDSVNPQTISGKVIQVVVAD